MISSIEKPIELVKKKYLFQTISSHFHENSFYARLSRAKVSATQPSRRNSVHDINENTRDDLNKVSHHFSLSEFLFEKILVDI